MSVKAAWIPKSEKGRRVARFLRAEAFALRDKDVQGHYLCNIPGADELTAEQLREIAYILNPEYATYDEERAYRHADRIREEGHRLGMTPEETERAAKHEEIAWLY